MLVGNDNLFKYTKKRVQKLNTTRYIIFGDKQKIFCSPRFSLILKNLLSDLN